MSNNESEKDNHGGMVKIPGGRPGGMGSRHHKMMMGPVVKAKDVKATLCRLWYYLGRQKSTLLTVFTFVLIGALLNLLGPYLIGVAIDRYIIPGDFEGLQYIALVMIAIYGLNVVSTWLQNYWMIGMAQNTVLHMRKDLFNKLQTLPLSFFDNKPHGELMSRLTNDIENISNTLNTSTTQIFSSIITIVGTFLFMLWLSPALTLLSIIVIPLMAACTKLIAKRTRNYFSEQQKHLGELNGLIEETISGQRVVKVFSREKKVIEKFDAYNLQLREAGMRAQIFSGLIPPLMNVLNNLSLAIVAGAGGWLAVEGVITVGIIASFISYAKQFTRPLNELANQFNMIQSAIAGAERVFEIMDEKPETIDSPNAVKLDNIAGEVDFDQVSFGYKEEVPVLKGIDLHVKPGQAIALVGPTGAGKTTIINLLMRFYDVSQGQIRIDGQEIKTIKRNDLRTSLGIVLQDTYLFSESVKENIRYGRLDATDEEIEAAARLANADGFIRRLSQGYDTVLSEDGGNLSQGQRQLLAIARAILADPAILILDEATSSVDTRTEVQIQQAMLNLMKGRTSFVIAHRLSTIRDADKIVVIDRGEIREQGTHEELLQKKGFYHQLYMSQFHRQVS
ncbi:ABC transporter ATP-binding protein [Geosporobacter ferrireducens]|nr:ABC transporter ATP-binding protein [Geosporobacter ferrireducens]MTI53482.1 ABC transporter ATP-binding protein [Geosporobacter ferrireducens]